MNRRLVTMLGAGAASLAGLAAITAGGVALASAGHFTARAAGASSSAHLSAAQPASAKAPAALQPQSNIPALNAPGGAQAVSYPPDGVTRSQPITISVTAPQNTRIVGLDLQCDANCPVTISANGKSAAGRIPGNSIFVRPWLVYVQADGNAPLAGGRFSGTFTMDGESQPLTVDITAGTQGSPSIFPSNAPNNGGVNVAFVMPGSAADRSGLLAGDVITTVDGRATQTINAFTGALAGLRSGAIVPVTIRRNGRFQTLDLELD